MDVQCPYCKKKYDVWQCPDWDDTGWEMKCPNCGKDISIDVDVEYSYRADKIPE